MQSAKDRKFRFWFFRFCRFLAGCTEILPDVTEKKDDKRLK